LLEDPCLADFNPEFYLVALQKIIRDRRPLVTLLGHTAQGMDLSPALAARLSLPLVTDCLEAQLVDGTLQVQRQIYGGKINASLSVKPSSQYLITLRPGAFPADTVQDKDGLSEIIPAPVWEGLRGRRFLNYLDAQLEDLDIADAGILVSVGRGIGKPESISLVQDFADTIGATLSCSRPVADKGWLPKSRQVGTSGKTVRPKVYLALGISGAFQHQAGMKNSGTIIAVNKDSRAPIFSVAHYGIVGDLFQILPVLMEKFVKK
jgi:electron transfer flavoprotein alpha subunit